MSIYETINSSFRWSCSTEEPNMLGWHLSRRSALLLPWDYTSWSGSVSSRRTSIISSQIQILLPNLHPCNWWQASLSQESVENVLSNRSKCWRVWCTSMCTWHTIWSMCAWDNSSLQSFRHASSIINFCLPTLFKYLWLGLWYQTQPQLLGPQCDWVYRYTADICSWSLSRSQLYQHGTVSCWHWQTTV